MSEYRNDSTNLTPLIFWTQLDLERSRVLYGKLFPDPEEASQEASQGAKDYLEESITDQIERLNRLLFEVDPLLETLKEQKNNLEKKLRRINDEPEQKEKIANELKRIDNEIWNLMRIQQEKY